MGLGDFAYGQEIIFAGSMIIVLFLMSRLIRELDPTIAKALVGTAIIIPQVGIGNALVLGVTTTIVTLLLLFFITRPFAVAFPQGVVTVGDLATATLPPGYEEAAKQQMTDEEVWDRLQRIVADILGVKVDDITPTARFVEDLGAG